MQAEDDVGARDLPLYVVIANVLAYAVAALAMQAAAVVANVITPPSVASTSRRRSRTGSPPRVSSGAGLIALGLGIALLCGSGPHLIEAIRTA